MFSDLGNTPSFSPRVAPRLATIAVLPQCTKVQNLRNKGWWWTPEMRSPVTVDGHIPAPCWHLLFDEIYHGYIGMFLCILIYIYDSHMFNLLCFYMVLPFFVYQQYVELDSLSNVSHLHDSRHPFCGDRFGHHEMRWSKLSAPTWRHQIAHLGQFFKNRVTPKHPFLQNGKNNALGYIYF